MNENVRCAIPVKNGSSDNVRNLSGTPMITHCRSNTCKYESIALFFSSKIEKLFAFGFPSGTGVNCSRAVVCFGQDESVNDGKSSKAWIFDSLSLSSVVSRRYSTQIIFSEASVN